MGDQVTELITIIGVVTGLALVYWKAFAGYQAAITQIFINAFTVPSRFRRLLNLIVGIVIASAFTVVGALWLGSWAIVPAGLRAGILAAVEAGKAHDAGAVAEPSESAPPPAPGSP
jgi:ABC-type Mn2+/Zn2+ transport system permease subunit